MVPLNNIIISELEHAEWDDESKTNLRVIWKTPETLAGEIYNWAQVNGYTGTVFTIFELHSDEEHMDSGGLSRIPTQYLVV